MASGLPYAVAASFAFSDRPSIVVVGDVGFAMLMVGLSTGVFYQRDVKALILGRSYSERQLLAGGLLGLNAQKA